METTTNDHSLQIVWNPRDIAYRQHHIPIPMRTKTISSLSNDNTPLHPKPAYSTILSSTSNSLIITHHKMHNPSTTYHSSLTPPFSPITPSTIILHPHNTSNTTLFPPQTNTTSNIPINTNHPSNTTTHSTSNNNTTSHSHLHNPIHPS